MVKELFVEFEGIGRCLRLDGRLIHNDWSLSDSSSYFLPLNWPSMSRNIDRNVVATRSSGRRPNGQVPVVSISSRKH